jgi:DNA-binding GntR family transcriptional regulator
VPGLPAIDAPSGAALARAVLRELQHLDLEGQNRAVELGSARADDAKELDRLPGAPVLVVTTRYFAEGRTAAVSVATYRADTCRLTFGDSGGVEIHHDPERRAS